MIEVVMAPFGTVKLNESMPEWARGRSRRSKTLGSRQTRQRDRERNSAADEWRRERESNLHARKGHQILRNCRSVKGSGLSSTILLYIIVLAKLGSRWL